MWHTHRTGEILISFKIKTVVLTKLNRRPKNKAVELLPIKCLLYTIYENVYNNYNTLKII